MRTEGFRDREEFPRVSGNDDDFDIGQPVSLVQVGFDTVLIRHQNIGDNQIWRTFAADTRTFGTVRGFGAICRKAAAR